MKVFLSWSGELSRQIALALSEWLPLVNHHIKPFMSSEDIQKGSRWLSHLSQELQDTNFGILCLTRDNVEAPWVCFEAGALAKIIDTSLVAPILFGLLPSDVKGPLAQFQATKFEYEDFSRLVFSINACVGSEARDEATLEQITKIVWPKIEEKINGLMKECAQAAPLGRTGSPEPADPRFGDILEELLVLARQQSQVLSDPKSILPPDYIGRMLERHGRYDRHVPPGHPAWSEIFDGYEVLQRLRRSGYNLNPSESNQYSFALEGLERGLRYVLDRFGIRHRRPRAPNPMARLSGVQELESKLPISHDVGGGDIGEEQRSGSQNPASDPT